MVKWLSFLVQAISALLFLLSHLPSGDVIKNFNLSVSLISLPFLANGDVAKDFIFYVLINGIISYIISTLRWFDLGF